METTQIKFGKISASALVDPPSISSTSNTTSIHAGSMSVHLTINDTVGVMETDDEYPMIIGRILFINNNPEKNINNQHIVYCGRAECIHPNASFGGPLVRVQIYIPRFSTTVATSYVWPSLSQEFRLPTHGLTEAAPTNCIVWISSDQIENTIFFPHVDGCYHQIYGPLAGRVHTNFVRFYICLEHSTENDSVQFTFHPIGTQDYDAFGETTNTKTYRRMETLMHITRITQQLLIKNGRLGGTYGKQCFYPLNLDSTSAVG